MPPWALPGPTVQARARRPEPVALLRRRSPRHASKPRRAERALSESRDRRPQAGLPPASDGGRSPLSAPSQGATSDGGMPSRGHEQNPFVAAITLVLGAARRERFRVALIGGFALPFHGVRRSTGDVDFLADARGADALDAALLGAGARRLHRGPDAANYAGVASQLAAVDFIFARRPRADDMLRRARRRALRAAGLRVPVVDAEALIGLKLQALVNAPARRLQDQADIRALLDAGRGALRMDLIRDYYRLFEREAELDRLLHELERG